LTADERPIFARVVLLKPSLPIASQMLLMLMLVLWPA